MKNLEVDNLLKDDEKLESLRKFRNGAFHVQKEYFSEKYLDFIAARNSAEWVSNLSQVLGMHLASELRKIGNEEFVS